MNSSISTDLPRQHLALLAANCLKDIAENTKNLSAQQKELLELNLSITTYVEESKIRLKALRLELANQANSSIKVAEILSRRDMSQSQATPQNQSKTRRLSTKITKEDNNNTNSKHSKRQNARTFVAWYKQMIDHDRQNLVLYLSDDATLEWFGRTIKSRKKVTAFLRYDMQCSRHDFRSVDCIDHIPRRHEPILRRNETALATPLENSPEICKSGPERGKRRLLPSNSNSPEWAENCGPDSDVKPTERKRQKKSVQLNNEGELDVKLRIEKDSQECLSVSNKGDFAFIKRVVKRKCCMVTPPNLEVGQGDCLPSTSGTDSDRSHETLNAQLPRLAVECDGYIEFNRTRNHSIDSVKWERKCKVQISYSEDPLNVGEYIIWNIRYNDETKCRRNLLSAFEEIAKEEELKR